MTTTPPSSAAGQEPGTDPGETADPTAALEQAAGVELGMTEDGSTFEPEEDAEG